MAREDRRMTGPTGSASGDAVAGCAETTGVQRPSFRLEMSARASPAEDVM